MQLINIDQKWPECCSISTEDHIKESLGSPMKLPPALADKLADKWANECEDDLLALFELMKGCEYKEAIRDNSYNSENDLDSFFVFTVYTPANASDWAWTRDSFVVVEIGAGGDPRYSAYGPAMIFDLCDNCLGDTQFFEWKLGWWAEPINQDRYDEKDLDPLNDRISSCYSSSPFYELEQLTYSKPAWSDRLGCFLARFKDCSFPVRLMPIEPCY